MITVGSLFDGIGGTPLCAQMSGAVGLWASEIESIPISITKHHFPGMRHLGDITAIKGDQIPAVDIIVGGSPCQDLSVAGKRAGIFHEDLGDDKTTRSGLFIDQARIVKEMRKNARATNQPVRPRFVVWENVPGAFSSNGGEDFRVILEEFCRIADETVSIPRPPRGKWSNAGCIMGDGFSLAWRVVDAQYWGTPQRHRRIYLVLDLGGNAAPEILFERKGVSGDSAQGSDTREGIAADASGSTGETSGGVIGFSCKASASAGTIGIAEEMSPTILAARHDAAICHVFENHGQDSRITGPLDVSPTVCRKYGTGGNNVPLVARQTTFDGYAMDYTTSTLKARDYKSATDAVVEKRVRRLTPLECERLQGYPDGWTEFGAMEYAESIKRKHPKGFQKGLERTGLDEENLLMKISDSARYRGLGNSFYIKNAHFVISRCVAVLEGRDT